MPTRTDLLVVGAGPQALTLLTYLKRLAPDFGSVMVVDPHPWLHRWDTQFEALRIPMLRSGCVHHPDPDPYALIDFARREGRVGEFDGPIGRPSTRLFKDFCDVLIEDLGLEQVLVQGSVTRLRPRGDRLEVLLSTGRTVLARRVVLATNPVIPVLPGWMRAAQEKHRGEPGLAHSGQVSIGTFQPGNRLMVIGGGLTAVQLVEGANAVGADVVWVTRSALRVRDLDVEATWLGPQLADFLRLRDPAWRVGRALRARGGGSVPARERWQVDDLVRGGSALGLHGCTVKGVRRRKGRWHVDVERHGSCRSFAVDHVVAATGTRAHVRRDALLRPLSQEAGARHCQGFPVLSPDLRPTPWPVHVMGALALSEVGPAARTIIGARIASERLLPAVAGVQISRRQYPHPAGE